MSLNTPIEVEIRRNVCGRYRAIVHDGKGREIRSTPYGKNKITNLGFEFMLTRGDFYMRCCAGSGNSPPQETDSNLQSYRGAASVTTSVVKTVQADPSAGPLFWRITTRFTFPPGSFGSGSVNIAEAGMQVSVGPTFTDSTPLASRGLLVDSEGAPTAIAVAPDEFLDIVWEYTEYLPYDTTSIATITNDGVPTDYTFTYRPMFLNGDGYTWGTWQDPVSGRVRAFEWFLTNLGGASFEGQGFMLSNGVLGPPNNRPTGNTSDYDPVPQSATPRAYVPGSKERLIDVTWTLAKGNVPSPGATIIKQNTGHASWQIGVNPPIPKVVEKQLNLVLKLSMVNVS